MESYKKQIQELNNLLMALSELNIDYCLLQPFVENVFFSTSDIDIYIEKKNFDQVKRYLFLNGWKKISHYKFTNLRTYYFKIVSGFKIKLDVAFEYVLFDKSYYYIFNREVKKRLGNDGFLYLDDVSGFFMMLKKADIKGHLNHKKKALLSNLFDRTEELKKIYPDFSKDINGVFNKRKEFIDNYFIRGSKSNFDIIEFIKLYCSHFRLSQGHRVISLIGLDGAGKGTYKAIIYKEFEKRNLSVKELYLGYSSYQLLVLKKLVKLKSLLKIKYFNKIFALIYLLLLPYEFLLRRGFGKFDLILTDRHPLYETIFQPNSSFRIYDRLISFLCPPPDLVLYLSGDSETLWKRKKEIKFEEYLGKKKKIEDLIEFNLPMHETDYIDTVGDVNKVSKLIIEKIEEYIKNNY